MRTALERISSWVQGLKAAKPDSQPRAPREKPLPAAPEERAKRLVQTALEACSQGAWSTAENHLRLALRYAPANANVEAMLREVVSSREAERRASNQFSVS